MDSPVTIATPTDDTVVARATVSTDPVLVWDDLTDADALLEWFWPARLDPLIEVTPEIGGGLRVLGQAIDMGFTAVFKEVEPPHRFLASWQWDGDDAVSTVEVQLVPSDDGTELVVTHSDNPTEEAVRDHAAGWSDCLGRLVARHTS
jgi:uncharacterized protein YndB with AHSA1/START domain